jgi:hypothetical protein
LESKVSFEPLVVEKMWFELCEEFDKINLRIVANTEIMKMEIDSTLLYSRIFGEVSYKMSRSRILNGMFRKRLLWISSWDCLGLSLDMTPFG